MRCLKLLLAAGLILAVTGAAGANTVASSTMWFKGVLTPGASESYTGVLAMVDEAAESVGDGIGGFDVYAREGAMAWFGDGAPPATVWTPVTIASHDAWPGWPTDTPDWYQYSLELSVDGGQFKWALRNHAGATAADPWSSDPATYPARGVPMSGTMDWATMTATETDVGAYLTGMGTAEIPGGAAGQGGGAGYWDLDWSWGSEAVPLEYAGFLVEMAPTGKANEFLVSLRPIPEPVTVLGVFAGVLGLGSYLRKRRAD